MEAALRLAYELLGYLSASFSAVEVLALVDLTALAPVEIHLAPVETRIPAA